MNKDAYKDAEAAVRALELPYLLDIQQLVSSEITKRQRQAKQDAIIQIQKIAAEAGLNLATLIKDTKAVKAAVVPVAPKYVDPTNPTNLWSGRGRQPNWVKAQVEIGKTLDDLLIAKA